MCGTVKRFFGAELAARAVTLTQKDWEVLLAEYTEHMSPACCVPHCAHTAVSLRIRLPATVQAHSWQTLRTQLCHSTYCSTLPDYLPPAAAVPTATGYWP